MRIMSCGVIHHAFAVMGCGFGCGHRIRILGTQKLACLLTRQRCTKTGLGCGLSWSPTCLHLRIGKFNELLASGQSSRFQLIFWRLQGLRFLSDMVGLCGAWYTLANSYTLSFATDCHLYVSMTLQLVSAWSVFVWGPSYTPPIWLFFKL